jgi:hypothetical protein
MTRGTHEWREPSDRRPGGEPGVVFVGGSAPFDTRRPGLTGCLTLRPQPHRLFVWEPLPTKAPKPPKAAPYCCYLRTVIFYHFPHLLTMPRPYRDRDGVLRPGSHAYFQWDQIESRLMWDDVVEFERDHFVVTSGRVVWSGGWWMVYGARRKAA